MQCLAVVSVGNSLTVHDEMSYNGQVSNICFVISGCGSAWLERLVWDQEVAGSNPVTPMFNFGLSGQDVLAETWAFWVLNDWSEEHLSTH